jgi:aryl-alcohol dehydrogenase-like predicted oxidoreductase
METRSIGAVDATVVGLGCNQLGVTVGAHDSAVVLRAAVEAGVLFFDTADEYGAGASESVLGAALTGRRDQVRIATKAGAVLPGVPGSGGASVAWIRRALEGSLRRLRTDRVDLYQVHYPDPAVPEEETLGVLGELRQAGKILEFGCCNYPSARLAAAFAGAPPGGCYASLQVHLNLLRQRALDDEVATAGARGMQIVPYWPLASGLLAGKYRRGAGPAPGSRMSVYPDAARRMLTERNFARLDALGAVAREAGCTLVELAFAWLLALTPVATVIAGATRPEQVAANARAGQRALELSAEVVTAAGAAVQAAR